MNRRHFAKGAGAVAAAALTSGLGSESRAGATGSALLEVGDPITDGTPAGGVLTGTYPNPEFALEPIAPGTPAGGVLTGTYPNPEFALEPALMSDLDAIPEMAAADPTEVSLTTVGAVTTLGLQQSIARTGAVRRYAKGQYYFHTTGATTTFTPAVNNLYLTPVILTAGTIEFIGLEVTTAVAGSTVRLGIYADASGMPSTLVASSAPVSTTTTGVKDALISAVIPAAGYFWFAHVSQGGAPTMTGLASQVALPIPLPLGTAPPGGTTVHASRVHSNVTGALPTSVILSSSLSAMRPRLHFKYKL